MGLLLWGAYYIMGDIILLWGLIMGGGGGLLWLGAAATHNIITHNCYIALFSITFYTPITELLYGKYSECRDMIIISRQIKLDLFNNPYNHRGLYHIAQV